ncbi:beta-hexosaminidase [Caulobacter vibrioides]|uniref:beta-N-acetylhexosaminidase n=1 Tax=Caulobacter vibrioides TaxID=155892 RepID=UPI000BB4A5E2|nr:family 20 glycosylhydrolase [Caulobacter vibrioides]ATC23446.1 beta-hexosaminidase [Caulobacter vibrioides]AZH11658.1 beta-hexosaminidase [Caulobacter vibrioides]PLR11280.1 beta-hexosaminidase [Caulobacter vibrioides]
MTLTPLRIVAVSAFALTAALATGAFADSLTITPAPAKVVRAEGTFTLSAATRIHVARGDVEAKGVALQLADLIQRSRGFRPKVVEGPPAADAIVLTREGPGGEAYKLDINAKGATIAAAKRAGLFYGAMSLWQLATPDEAKGPVALPAASIEDAPRFAWRGLMIDSARHYQSLDTLKAVIDAMAAHKLNTFHWHLVDDQGWRLEIKKYPKLTQVAAWRRNPGAAVRYPKYGGFYTQDQARELVAYAAARNITVVPEIETPGHALAPIVAYPQLGTAPPDASKMGDWGIFPWLYNTDDATFAFLDDVLNEVMDIFPSTFIHVGGDEAIKDQWKASPKVQAKIKELGLKDEHELQSWFIQRVGKSLEKRGRRLIGWDEILEGGLAPNATVMSWRGIDGAIAAAKQGHDTVLSPHPVLYLDHRQSASAEEPTGRGHISSLKDVYAFDPAPVQLTPDERKHILGVQANVWTEHMQTDQRMQLMAFPRAVALAERAWSPEASADWDGFAKRLPAEMARLKVLGVAANPVPFEPQPALSEAEGGKTRVALSTGLGVGQIRYTTDGKAPTATSSTYAGPIALPTGAVLKAQTFVEGQPLGRERSWTMSADLLQTRTSGQLKLCTQQVPLTMIDDAPAALDQRPMMMVDIFNPCWIWEGARLDKGAMLSARVTQIPFNFQVGKDRDKIPLHPPATPGGELEVRLGCSGERIAAIPLGDAARNPGLSTIEGRLPARAEKADLCLTFTSRSLDPFWVVERMTLKPAN